MIALKAVSKSYSGKPKVLDQINLSLNKGDFLYLVGGAGAGKTTLLKLLSTEEAPTTGSISLFGYPLATASSSTRRAIRQTLGYIPQDIRLIPDFTLYENVALALDFGGIRNLSAEAKGRINEWLERVGLIDRRNQLARTLSGGEAQKLAIARAMVRNPELLLADEPTGAQDRESSWSIMDIFLKTNFKGTTIILATHDREIVRRVRKRCAMLRQGRLLMEEMLCTY